MDNVKNLLGQKLKELRGNQTLYRAADEMNMNRRQLQRYEEGRLPEDEPLEKIAVYYNVPFVELKELYFEDLYPQDSKNRDIILQWAQKLLKSGVDSLEDGKSFQ
jgi:transcriptional regulator with XRE-family HTH domain